MSIIINKNTAVTAPIAIKSVQIAAENLRRDIRKTCLDTKGEGAEIRLLLSEGEFEAECFALMVSEERLEIKAADELGFIYGIYEVSRSILGVNDFWFWNDQEFIPKESYEVSSNYLKRSKPFAIRYRGWFVNDEVLLHTWYVNRRKDEPWEMVFEALLRLGGNMVIPGTDRNAHLYRDLAAETGLFITHHHAEPLGAEMFARAYPDLNPSYEEHPEKFERLWREGIERQKDKKVIWNLGFRGQGDCPFWDNDPRYDTDEARGELMSMLIKKQYDLVKENDKDAPCCTNLYGETMELYQKGHLKLPTDIIKIWADNGFGKMVTRRQNNHNPRIYALPEKKNEESHGIYYHVSFYDLQAANHITMLPNSPEFVKKELGEVLEKGVDDFWIINCSNVKPHVYLLDFVGEFWREGSVDIERQRESYVERYYGGEGVAEIADCLKAYPEYAFAYGKEEDEHAGEQFSNHVARILISRYMGDKQRADELLWLMEDDTLSKQVKTYQKMCFEAKKQYYQYFKMCEQTAASLEGHSECLFRDSLFLQAQIHYECFEGAYKAAKSLTEAIEKNYQKAFYLAGKARKHYLKADEAMRSREHGKWKDFYENECLADVKQTAWVLSGLMSYLRNLGDGPHFYHWQREFLYAKEDSRVMLILNMENHLTDEEIFSLMEERFEESETK
ncbi:glycosyl hydrolase 115 family protein [Konateibacter massiliensis]|uniref:glycosyl hydrolase 115 family protein n=1 Tax=Konateibacter massiliensis TaxID=2002841 RepID=UPI000C15033C|nr:glycosyl hydrolase 115 family protein [Konateibacter massiliensis]